MTATFRHYMTVALLIMMTLALSVNAVIAQEEVEAAEATGSDGLMIAVIGIGILMILGLGAAMSTQASEEQSASN